MADRNLPKVIEAILKTIPAGPEYEGLHSDLKSIQDSALYCAPEGMRMWWSRLTGALSDDLAFPPETEWEKRILGIVKDEIDVGAREIENA